MEKFYALVTSIREVSDRSIMNSSSVEIVNKEVAEQSKTKRPKFEKEKPVVVWKPSFQREDSWKRPISLRPCIRLWQLL